MRSHWYRSVNMRLLITQRFVVSILLGYAISIVSSHSLNEQKLVIEVSDVGSTPGQSAQNSPIPEFKDFKGLNNDMTTIVLPSQTPSECGTKAPSDCRTKAPSDSLTNSFHSTHSASFLQAAAIAACSSVADMKSLESFFDENGHPISCDSPTSPLRQTIELSPIKKCLLMKTASISSLKK